MRWFAILVLAIILIAGCINQQVTDQISGDSFKRVTLEEIFENPELYENEKVVITAKIFEESQIDFDLKRYDPDSGLMVEETKNRGVQSFEDPVVIGNETKMIVYDYNKKWEFIDDDVSIGPYDYSYYEHLKGKFYEDFLFDFYGEMNLEVTCTCEMFTFTSIEKNIWPREFNLSYNFEDNISYVVCERVGNSCTKNWRDEVFGFLKRECDFYKGKCIPNTESETPVMKFIDAKIKTNLSSDWNLDYIKCYDIDSNGKMIPCKNIEYTIIEK